MVITLFHYSAGSYKDEQQNTEICILKHYLYKCRISMQKILLNKYTWKMFKHLSFKLSDGFDKKVKALSLERHCCKKLRRKSATFTSLTLSHATDFFF